MKTVFWISLVVGAIVIGGCSPDAEKEKPRAGDAGRDVQPAVYADSLERIRQSYRAFRNDKKLYDALSEMFSFCSEETKKRMSALNSKNSSTDAGKGASRGRRGKTLQEVTKNGNVLSPMMKMFPHLRLKGPGTLDCRVRGDHLGGFSTFLIRNGQTLSPLEVVLDGSCESAWERVVLDHIESQFYLAWHARYWESWMLTSVTNFDELVKSPLGEKYSSWAQLGSEGQQKALDADLTPCVSMDKGVAEVSYCVFLPFGGLFRFVDRVEMDTGKVSRIKSRCKCLVEYNCPMRY